MYFKALQFVLLGSSFFVLLCKDARDSVCPEPESVLEIVLDDGELGVNPEDVVSAGGQWRPGRGDVLGQGGGWHAGLGKVGQQRREDVPGELGV